MKESTFWALMKTNLPGHVTRIENTAGIGTPDVNICHKGVEVWLELKVAKGHYIFLRTSQVAFCVRRVAEKGRIFFVTRYGDEILIFTGEELLNCMEHIEGITNKACKLHLKHISESFVFTKPYAWKSITDLVYYQ